MTKTQSRMPYTTVVWYVAARLKESAQKVKEFENPKATVESITPLEIAQYNHARGKVQELRHLLETLRHRSLSEMEAYVEATGTTFGDTQV